MNMLPTPSERKEVIDMSTPITFLVSVLASAVASYIGKWLNGE